MGYHVAMDPLTIAYLLIVLGLALLVAELFIPTSGILFLVSSLLILGGVVVSFIYDPAKGMVVLLVVFVVVPAVARNVTPVLRAENPRTFCTYSVSRKKLE